MVSGLTGASRQHSHFFRDLARSARADALARDQDSARVETASDDQDATANVEGEEAEAKNSEEMIGKLESRNREVLAHEAAHMAAGGAYIKGGASYTYQIGPDGKSYAIGGEVGIDMTPVAGNPRATINKMMAIQAAATSPDDPSGQDMSVASAAARIEAQARAQLDEASSENSDPTMRTAASRYKPSATSAGTFVNSTA
jgi:hypothetical protein